MFIVAKRFKKRSSISTKEHDVSIKIETGHHTRPKIQLESRKCDTCPDSIENELHVIIECPRYLSFRKVLYTKVNEKDADFIHAKEQYWQTSVSNETARTQSDKSFCIFH